jgi:hypothetical protein
MSTHTDIPALMGPQQALDVGYAEGSKLRANGAKPERRMSPHYKPWRRGFDAGYLGQDKPTLP